jgi:hypothetical protein
MQGQAMARRIKEAKKSRIAEQQRKSKMLTFLTRSPKKTLEAIPPGQSELVQQLTQQQYGELRMLFDQFDSDGSGTPPAHNSRSIGAGAQPWHSRGPHVSTRAPLAGQLSEAEMKAALRLMGVAKSDEEIEELFTLVDLDRNGTIEWGEFLEYGASLINNGSILESQLELAFTAVSKHCSAQGTSRKLDLQELELDRRKLMELLTTAGFPPFTVEEAEEFCNVLDPQGTGRMPMAALMNLPCWASEDELAKLRQQAASRPPRSRRSSSAEAFEEEGSLPAATAPRLLTAAPPMAGAMAGAGPSGLPLVTPTPSTEPFWWAPVIAPADERAARRPSNEVLPAPPPAEAQPSRATQLPRERPSAAAPPAAEPALPPFDAPSLTPHLVPEPEPPPEPTRSVPPTPPPRRDAAAVPSSSSSIASTRERASVTSGAGAVLSALGTRMRAALTSSLPRDERAIESIPNERTAIEPANDQSYALQSLEQRRAPQDGYAGHGYPTGVRAHLEHSSSTPGAITGLTRVPINAPLPQVMAHAIFEAAQAKLEAVQVVAQARMQLAHARLAVVHSHVENTPSDDKWVGGVWENLSTLWPLPQDLPKNRDRQLFA